jgi:hypothetical protein
MNKNFAIFAGFFVILGAVAFLIFSNTGTTYGKYDVFAQCLASKGITMYGANWCSHCQNEKKAFGNSFKLVPYVECPEDPKKCLAAGITGYPTWVFPDGRKLEGEQGLEKLSQESGCQLQITNN